MLQNVNSHILLKWTHFLPSLVSLLELNRAHEIDMSFEDGISGVYPVSLKGFAAPEKGDQSHLIIRDFISLECIRDNCCSLLKVFSYIRCSDNYDIYNYDNSNAMRATFYGWVSHISSIYRKNCLDRLVPCPNTQEQRISSFIELYFSIVLTIIIRISILFHIGILLSWNTSVFYANSRNL